MSIGIGGAGKFSEQILATLRDIQREVVNASKDAGVNTKSGNDSGASFLDHLKDGVKEVNNLHKNADKMAVELATGKTGNIHDTMLAASQAELSFNLMVQLRNKGLEAYSEIMHMQV